MPKQGQHKNEYPLVLTITNPAAACVIPSGCAQMSSIRCHFLSSVSSGWNHKREIDKIEGLQHLSHASFTAQIFPDSYF